jgi:hypothetical protein
MMVRSSGCWVLLALSLLLASCGGHSTEPAQAAISISLSTNSLTVLQDGTPASVTVTVQRPAGNGNFVTLTATSLYGLSEQITSPGTGDTGQVTFTVQNGEVAGPHGITIQATDGTTSASASLALDIVVMATVRASTNTGAGFNGTLQNFMATSFQPADWDYQFFESIPKAAATLSALDAQHIRLQPVSGGTPQKADQSWDFTMLDAILDPVIATGDKSPELQLAVAPAWMNDSNGHLMPAHFSDFAAYAANVVKYYNTTTGFTDSQGVTHVHSATNPTPITWWGVFNEPNINGLEPADYLNLYNVVVPAMLSAGSIVPIKFVAVELSDWGSEPQRYLPTFMNGVTAQVDAIGTHYYSTCNQSDLDTTLFASIPGVFVPHVEYIYQQLKSVPQLASVPVWITENNVNADYSGANGMSVCNPSQKFVLDQRGTSAFFAAWRPYLFSQLGQAGAQSLYHWDFDADAQYGEVSFSTGQTYLSYWVDYTLQRYFPFCDPGASGCAGSGSTILESSTTEQAGAQSIELLATRNPDTSVVVMLSDHAVNAASDNNGPGQPRTVMLDVSALAPFESATQLTLDANTDPIAGPAATSVSPASQMTVQLGGYGTTFLTLNPATGHALPAAPAQTASARVETSLFEVALDPPSISMTVAPATIALGASARIAWRATNAVSCTGSGDLTGPQPLKGSMTFTPTFPGSYTATLTCTGAGGTVAQSALLAVNMF